MDYRLTQLETELSRLRADCARMKVMLETLQNREHIDSTDIAFLGTLIMILTFSSWLWFSLG